MKDLLTFDDVLISPQFSEIRSRKDVDISYNGSGFPYMSLPVLSANMDTVTESEMAMQMIASGGQAVLHRFCSIEDNVKMLLDSRYGGTGSIQVPSVSLGLGDLELERAIALKEVGAYSFFLDVAHGASIAVVEQTKALRKQLGDHVSITVGNFATGESVKTFLEHSGNIIDGIKVGIGPGCFAKGTRILMANGIYKNIEDIELHDKVINKNGKSVDVIGVKFSGLRKTLSYKNNLFYKKTYVTPDHLHWIGDYSTIKNIDGHSIVNILSKLTKKEESKLKWSPIGDNKKITLLLPNKIQFDLPETFGIDLNNFALSRRNLDGLVNHPKINQSYDLGYVFGTFLGDGCSNIHESDRLGDDGIARKNTSGSTAWYFGKEELCIAEKLIRCIKNSIGTNATLKETKNMWMVFNRNNHISRMLLEFGKRDKKRLPLKYMCSDKEYLKGILDGLIDSDGSYCKDGRVIFGNTSPELLEQFNIIFYLINGYFPSSSTREPTIGGLKNCNIDNCKESYLSRSVIRPEFNNLESFQINRINSWDEEYLFLPTYDIEVDCDTHSFIANNAIVHNSACSTRIKTGIGIPQLSAIIDISNTLKNSGLTIIADGGMRKPGDIAKALGAGAHLVMLGGMLAGTEETPGSTISKSTALGATINGEWMTYKKYRGSASKESYEVQGKTASHRTEEGESFLVPYKGPVSDVLQDIEGGLRSSFSYVGAQNLKEFHTKVIFVKVSSNTVIENKAHGKN